MDQISDANSSQTTIPENDHLCKLILYMDVPNTKIRVWDVIILVPNLIFLLFLGFRFNRAILKLRATSSPIFLAFYGLVVLNTVMSVVRCIASMLMSAAAIEGSYIDIVLWVTVRFFLLSTEMSVVVFGLAFGHLDSRSSIRYVLLTTSFISFGYSTMQGALEIFQPDKNVSFGLSDNRIFGHGGMLFWCVSSVIFTLIYMVIFILPWTKLRERLPLPAKKSFYAYVLLLMLLNLSQAVGSGLLLFNNLQGICVVDVTTCIYYTLFTPLVYVAFLSDFFSIAQSSIMFSYKAQIEDNMDDDTVSLPHQQSFSSLKTDSDYIYQGNGAYDSTQFTGGGHGNMLYSASLQSPDSITGYSLNSQTIDIPAPMKPASDK
ncbi:unnamed protein product [Bemisia tabaci]|uniref:Transmembrane protein adipocyte-associated 1 homolog n=1 Tax=Bemisia tabaci TaxID=7038 RepID=A0A9P0AH78_BEMTA|nr:PREDICTED: transmembrane protein adipocyte-associated 1 homolog [Bemisia tabaci]CAH0391091.1 unnamed protein product [Bemisia tabaci]